MRCFLLYFLGSDMCVVQCLNALLGHHLLITAYQATYMSTHVTSKEYRTTSTTAGNVYTFATSTCVRFLLHLKQANTGNYRQVMDFLSIIPRIRFVLFW